MELGFDPLSQGICVYFTVIAGEIRQRGMQGQIRELFHNRNLLLRLWVVSISLSKCVALTSPSVSLAGSDVGVYLPIGILSIIIAVSRPTKILVDFFSELSLKLMLSYVNLTFFSPIWLRVNYPKLI